MREYINLIQQLSEEASTIGADGVKAKGLYPEELKKRDNFNLFISMIQGEKPFIMNATGEQVILNQNEAKRMLQMFKAGDFKGKKVTISTADGDVINLGELRKTEEFGGSTKENLKLKPSNIGITDKNVPASDLYNMIATNSVLSETDYGQVVQQLAEYIVAGEYVQLPPEYTKKDKESERKGIVDYAGEYLGVLALLYGRSRFPRRQQFTDWLGTDIGNLDLNFPSAANNNIADSYAIISNPDTNHSLNISSKGTGGGAAPAISGLKVSDQIRKNPKLKNAVKLIDICQEKGSIEQPFEIMDLIYKVNPNAISKVWHKFLPFSTKTPRLHQQCADSIKNDTTLPNIYQPIVNSVKSEKATDGGKLVYMMKKEIARAVNEGDAIPEFKDAILSILEMNFIQQYTDYHGNGELTFATQWPAKLTGVVTMENKSSAVEPTSAGFSFKLGRNSSDYENGSVDGEENFVASHSQETGKLAAQAAELTGGPTFGEPKEKSVGNPEVGNVGRKKR